MSLRSQVTPRRFAARRSHPTSAGFVQRVSALGLACALACSSSAALAQNAPAGAVKQLDVIEVQGTRIDAVEGGRVGTKMDVPLRETPQSVSVVTREQMELRGVQTVEEALRYSAGTSLPYGYEQRYDWIQLRGFDVVNDQFRDGLSIQGGSFSLPRLDPYALERVEILKGPAGVMYGGGSPGGLVNTVSKRPSADQVNEIGAVIGNHARRELHADIGGALGTGSGWLYRLVALASESETEVDFNEARKWLLMPSLQWRNDSTTLDLQATWQKTRARDYGSFTIAPYLRDVLAEQGVELDIPKSRYLGEPDSDRFDPDYSTFGWTLEHRFNDVLTLRQNARYNRTELDYRAHYLAGLNFANPDEITRDNLVVDELSQGVVVDTSLQAKLGDGRVRHTVLLGLDYRRVDNDANDGFGPGSNLDVLDPVYGAPITFPQQFRTETIGRQLGVYLQDHIKFDDRWVLLLGGRYDQARTASDGDFGASSFEDEAFSGRAGLVYVGPGGFAPYLSYSESFQPVNSVDAVTGSAFEPETGRQVELGTRWQPFGSDVLVSASIFDIRKQNIIITDPATSLRSQVGEVRSRGFEAEANTTIAPNTRLIAALTLLDTDTLRGDAGQPTGAPLPRVPERTLSAYLDYTIPAGVLAGLDVGIGVRYVADATIAATASLTTGERLDVESPDYTLLDASVHFPWRDWTFSLTGSNLADREYSIGCTELTCYRGYGRRINLAANFRW